MYKRLIILLLAIVSCMTLYAGEMKSVSSKTEDTDSLVSLLSAQSMQLIERNGLSYRQVTGPARFFHNNTYLICDTALWNVNTAEIEAIGNVKILQDQTVLTSDKLTYLINEDLAQFRGSVVQLQDKDRNTLRTRYLDYNTKDSIAVFKNGGAMQSKDGQIIESKSGTYDSKFKLFKFSEHVEMYTDSVFVSTTVLRYDTERDVATFGYLTDAWKDNGMLSSNWGWYDRRRDLFFFTDKVHGMSEDKEAWSDTLYFNRATSDIEMYGRAQLTDTLRKVSALGGSIRYVDSTSTVFMTRKPAIVGEMSDSNNKVDTVWFGADTLKYVSKPKCDVSEGFLSASAERLKNLENDAVTAFRRKAAEEAAKAAAEAAKNDPNRPQQPSGGKKNADSAGSDTLSSDETASVGKSAETPDTLSDGTDSLTVQKDTSSLLIGEDALYQDADSLLAVGDTLEVKDSTKIAFITAFGDAKMFRNDMQIRCDSLEFSDLDSLVRMYKKPVIWDQTVRQYTSDSLIVQIKNGRMDRANLLSNAFVVIQEDSLCYDQIRSSEMLAYFDSTAALSRYDALGDASAIFYLEEDSTLATVNKCSSKMLSAIFKEGTIDHIYYFEGISNDAIPLAQMKKDDRILKGFSWQPDRRPKSEKDITEQELRVSEMEKYGARPRPSYNETEIYFPGYMTSVHRMLEQAKQDKKRRQEISDSLALVSPKDTLIAPSDTLSSVVDTLQNPSDSLTVPTDSLAAVSDTLNTAVDTLSVKTPTVSAGTETKEEAATSVDKKALKEAKRAKKQAARALRIEEKEKKRARLDSLDAAKAKLKADKLLAKERTRKLKELKAIDRQKAKDDAILRKYTERLRKKKAREEAAAIRADEKASLKNSLQSVE